MVILDTSVIIDHLRQKKSAMTVLGKAKRRYGLAQLAVAVVSVQELYEGKSTRDPQELDRLQETLQPLTMVNYSPEIAERAGRLARDIGRPLEFADAAIAATAITHDAQLLTLNMKDFAGISALKLLKL